MMRRILYNISKFNFPTNFTKFNYSTQFVNSTYRIQKNTGTSILNTSFFLLSYSETSDIQSDKGLRKYLNKFFLSVHPDLLHDHSQQRKLTNERSLALLNAFLEETNNYLAGKQPNSPQDIVLEFFIAGSSKDSITQSFLFPHPDILSKLHFQKKVELYLLNLIETAGITVPETEDFKKKILEDATWISPEKNQMDEDDEGDIDFSQPGRVSKDFLQFLEKNWNAATLKEDSRSNSDSYNEKKVREKQLPVLQALVNTKLILYSNNLTTEERETAYNKFFNNLHLMDYENWYKLPIIFVKRDVLDEGLPKEQGHVIFPHDFSIEEKKNYLRINLVRLLAEKEIETKKLNYCLETIESVQSILGLDSFFIQDPSTCLPYLQILSKKSSISLLKRYPWKNVNIIINETEEPTEKQEKFGKFCVDYQEDSIVIKDLFSLEELDTFLSSSVAKKFFSFMEQLNNIEFLMDKIESKFRIQRVWCWIDPKTKSIEWRNSFTIGLNNLLESRILFNFGINLSTISVEFGSDYQFNGRTLQLPCDFTEKDCSKFLQNWRQVSPYE